MTPTKGSAVHGPSFVVGLLLTAFAVLVLHTFTFRRGARTALCPTTPPHKHLSDVLAAKNAHGEPTQSPSDREHSEQLLAALAQRHVDFEYQGRPLKSMEQPVKGLVPREESLDELSARPYHEHVPSLRAESRVIAKEGWRERTPSRPYVRREREGKCANAEATKLVMRALKSAREAFEDPVEYPPILDPAKGLYRDALRLDPACLNAKLSLVMLETAESCHEFDRTPWATWHRLDKEMADMDSGGTAGGSRDAEKDAKYWYWRSIVKELATNQTGESQYFFRKALEIDDGLRDEHLHPTTRFQTYMLRPVIDAKSFFFRKAFVQWLTYYEFMPYFGGYPKVTWEDTQRFARDWQIGIPDAMPRYCHEAVARVYSYVISGHLMDHTTRPDTCSHESPGDVLNTWMNVRIKEFIERLSGVKVKPTYGYTSGYKPGNLLRPHTDRDPCEFTLTYLMWAYPNAHYCPLYVQKTPWKLTSKWVGRFEDDTMKYDDVVDTRRQVGMWLVLRGRAKPHFAPALKPHTHCATLLAHFVPEDAERAVS